MAAGYVKALAKAPVPSGAEVPPRAALKYARPNFIKMVTLAQWIIIGFVGIYAVLFMEWDTKDTPFDGIRESVFSSVRAVFSSPRLPVQRSGRMKKSKGIRT
ncbi:hypothetical protein N7470_004521 [Penicillium chermesinum]|nr:hypothetical protein N7470_004521 [Penicillium chermesinum]